MFLVPIIYHLLSYYSMSFTFSLFQSIFSLPCTLMLQSKGPFAKYRFRYDSSFSRTVSSCLPHSGRQVPILRGKCNIWTPSWRPTPEKHNLCLGWNLTALFQLSVLTLSLSLLKRFLLEGWFYLDLQEADANTGLTSKNSDQARKAGIAVRHQA